MDCSPAYSSFNFEENEHYASPMSLPPARTPRDDERSSLPYQPSSSSSSSGATGETVTTRTPIAPLSVSQSTLIVPTTPAQIDSVRVQPTVQNIVSTVNLACKLKLKEIAMHAGNAEYNPRRFSAIIMRIRNPRTTLLIFESGKLVCTGAKTIADSNRAARRGARIIQKLGFDVKFLDFRIQNMVASVDINFQLLLSVFSIAHEGLCRFEPEVFPGLIYRIERPKVVLLIFSSGKIILTGAKDIETIYKAFDLIYPVLKRYRCTR